MFFKQDKLDLQLLDVLSFTEQTCAMRMGDRPFCALSLRTQGDTQIELRNKTLNLKAKDLAFFPANVGYVRRAKNDSMIVFHFNLSNYMTYEPEILKNFEFGQIQPLFTQAFDEWQSKKAGYYYRVSAILYSILAKIRTGLDDGLQTLNPQIYEAVEYIRTNYRDPSLCVSALADIAHMSQAYFRRLFKQSFSTSPKRYINDMRFEYAKSLLHAGYDSVAVVAEKSGFKDAKHFSTAFKKHFGFSPTAYVYQPL